MLRTSLRLACIIPAALFSLAALPGAAQENAQPAATPEATLPSIIVTEALERQLTDRVMATGTIRAVQEVYVQPLVDGLSIRTLEADVGDEVEAEQVLATLNEDTLILQKSQLEANKAKAEAGLAQYRAQVVEAQANLDDAVRQRDRATRLGKTGTSSVAEVERATAAAEVAEARLQAAQQAISVGEADIKVVESQIADIDLKLARTAVKTPVAGIVSARNAKVGAIASGAGEPLFTVIRDGALELVAELTETDIHRIKPGQRAVITIAGGSSEIEGEVRLVSPTVDPVSRLGNVRIDIDEKSGARAGMYGNAEIIIDEKTALALPLSAVTTARDGSYARKVEDGVVKQVEVAIGIQDGGFVEVTSGLAAGDMVVEKAGAFVRDGDRIKPVPAASTVSN
ncbi:HlyD family secretion protein [Pseudorhizobium banfieldiae]|uniref:HlyD family secretion protein n=1 Tax=Pseudorhizobium banfieldiae TaxID=1125847 RepID=L0NJ01_9HYPH|nr:efflux RND transporter periplasmic adaptor subunit [Pseudorhizobium banfieldiae]CAD6615456.1 efflux RND transporter periplasmic adaptor subunit [arsenite-oxidising bacterium NT-25]CAD6618379.1 efflux RND transporter periplasmic adaptor subunit [Rhizobium sp. TCK]CCF20257.1 HlyD family secretion protein [Pseudorhizobium banfieldiae]